jgi:hypothetical protein
LIQPIDVAGGQAGQNFFQKRKSFRHERQQRLAQQPEKSIIFVFNWTKKDFKARKKPLFKNNYIN